MSADMWQIISMIGFSLSGIVLIITIFIFIKFQIFSVIGDLSGRTASKQIRAIREQNVITGDKHHRVDAFNMQRGTLTDSVTKKSGRLGRIQNRSGGLQPGVKPGLTGEQPGYTAGRSGFKMDQPGLTGEQSGYTAGRPGFKVDQPSVTGVLTEEATGVLDNGEAYIGNGTKVLGSEEGTIGNGTEVLDSEKGNIGFGTEVLDSQEANIGIGTEVLDGPEEAMENGTEVLDNEGFEIVKVILDVHSKEIIE